MEKMLTYNDVENIIKEKGDCGIRGDKLRKIIKFFNYNIENKNFVTIFKFVNNIFVGTRLLNTINVNGDFTLCNQFSNFTSTWLKTLSLNTPKWRN